MGAVAVDFYNAEVTFPTCEYYKDYFNRLTFDIQLTQTTINHLLIHVSKHKSQVKIKFSIFPSRTCLLLHQ